MAKYKNKEIQSFLSNNMCRVFELPDTFTSDYCFSGGHITEFKMVDWFYPIPEPSFPFPDKSIFDATWNDIVVMNIKFLKNKHYYNRSKKYVVITEFNKSFMF